MNVEELRKRNILRREYADMDDQALARLVFKNWRMRDEMERAREIDEALDTLMWRMDPDEGAPSPSEWAAVLRSADPGMIRHLDCEGLAAFNGRFTRQLGGVWQMLECAHGETELASRKEVLDRENSGFWYPAACNG